MHVCAGWFESDGMYDVCVCVEARGQPWVSTFFFEAVSFSGTWGPLIWLSWLASEPRGPAVSTSPVWD